MKLPVNELWPNGRVRTARSAQLCSMSGKSRHDGGTHKDHGFEKGEMYFDTMELWPGNTTMKLCAECACLPRATTGGR